MCQCRVAEVNITCSLCFTDGQMVVKLYALMCTRQFVNRILLGHIFKWQGRLRDSFHYDASVFFWGGGGGGILKKKNLTNYIFSSELNFILKEGGI